MKYRLIISLLLGAEGVRQVVVDSHTYARWLYGSFLVLTALLIALSVRWKKLDRYLSRLGRSEKGVHRTADRKPADFYRAWAGLDKRERAISLAGLALSLFALLLMLWAPSGEKPYNAYDSVLIFFGLFALAYPFISRRFAWESRFIMLFLAFFSVFVVVAHKISRYLFPHGGFREYVNAHFTVLPFHAWLSVLGLETTRSGQFLYFSSPEGPTNLYIGPPCSGYFSMFTFLGVMVAYMVASRFPFKKWAALALLGLLIGYIANIFRLTILILVAMKYGMGTMQWVHAYLGTVLFVGWNLLFWIPVLYYFKKRGYNKTPRDNSRSGS